MTSCAEGARAPPAAGRDETSSAWANAAAGANSVRGDGTAFAAQTNAVTVVVPATPAVSIEPTRGTVNTGVDYTVSAFPANTAGTITWRRTSGSTIDVGTFQTDASGNASGSFPVPATPGGAGQVVTFAAGTVSKTATYEVAPRIKVGAGPVGGTVGVSLRGSQPICPAMKSIRPSPTIPFE